MIGGQIARFRFGVFEFNAETGELSRDGTAVKLQSQPARVLGILLAQAGDVVTRDALQQAVWGSETFVDFERGLNFCIAQIRSALGDSADSPRFVRTVPKQGYKFIAPVERVGDPPVLSPPAPKTTPASGVPRIGVLVAALVAVVVVAWGLHSWSVHSAPVRIGVLRFDNQTGNRDLDRFADGLTDSVVAELTAVRSARYGVIGNAAELRVPREQRDLRKIAESLGVEYVVLGQVQTNGAGIRVLAHLIRVPEQTHLTVSRQDLDGGDPTHAQTDVAKSIAADLARRLDALHAPSSN
jgi:DNA-binding winged helix-turn-helix (wHTH) protein/TolB-like protein